MNTFCCGRGESSIGARDQTVLDVEIARRKSGRSNVKSLISSDTRFERLALAKLSFREISWLFVLPSSRLVCAFFLSFFSLFLFSFSIEAALRAVEYVR